MSFDSPRFDKSSTSQNQWLVDFYNNEQDSSTLKPADLPLLCQVPQDAKNPKPGGNQYGKLLEGNGAIPLNGGNQGKGNPQPKGNGGGGNGGDGSGVKPPDPKLDFTNPLEAHDFKNVPWEKPLFQSIPDKKNPDYQRLLLHQHKLNNQLENQDFTRYKPVFKIESYFGMPSLTITDRDVNVALGGVGGIAMNRLLRLSGKPTGAGSLGALAVLGCNIFSNMMEHANGNHEGPLIGLTGLSPFLARDIQQRYFSVNNLWVLPRTLAGGPRGSVPFQPIAARDPIPHGVTSHNIYRFIRDPNNHCGLTDVITGHSVDIDTAVSGATAGSGDRILDMTFRTRDGIERRGTITLSSPAGQSDVTLSMHYNELNITGWQAFWRSTGRLAGLAGLTLGIAIPTNLAENYWLGNQPISGGPYATGSQYSWLRERPIAGVIPEPLGVGFLGYGVYRLSQSPGVAKVVSHVPLLGRLVRPPDLNPNDTHSFRGAKGKFTKFILPGALAIGGDLLYRWYDDNHGTGRPPDKLSERSAYVLPALFKADQKTPDNKTILAIASEINYIAGGTAKLPDNKTDKPLPDGKTDTKPGHPNNQLYYGTVAANKCFNEACDRLVKPGEKLSAENNIQYYRWAAGVHLGLALAHDGRSAITITSSVKPNPSGVIMEMFNSTADVGGYAEYHLETVNRCLQQISAIHRERISSDIGTLRNAHNVAIDALRLINPDRARELQRERNRTLDALMRTPNQAAYDSLSQFHDRLATALGNNPAATALREATRTPLETLQQNIRSFERSLEELASVRQIINNRLMDIRIGPIDPTPPPGKDGVVRKPHDINGTFNQLSTWARRDKNNYAALELFARDNIRNLGGVSELIPGAKPGVKPETIVEQKWHDLYWDQRCQPAMRRDIINYMNGDDSVSIPDNIRALIPTTEYEQAYFLAQLQADHNNFNRLQAFLYEPSNRSPNRDLFISIVTNPNTAVGAAYSQLFRDHPDPAVREYLNPEALRRTLNDQTRRTRLMHNLTIAHNGFLECLATQLLINDLSSDRDRTRIVGLLNNSDQNIQRRNRELFALLGPGMDNPDILRDALADETQRVALINRMQEHPDLFHLVTNELAGFSPYTMYDRDNLNRQLFHGRFLRAALCLLITVDNNQLNFANPLNMEDLLHPPAPGDLGGANRERYRPLIQECIYQSACLEGGDRARMERLASNISHIERLNPNDIYDDNLRAVFNIYRRIYARQ